IVINGRKWWISGADDLHNAIHLVMGKSDTSAPKHSQQSIVLMPPGTPGVRLMRPMQFFGYDGFSSSLFPSVIWLFENLKVAHRKGILKYCTEMSVYLSRTWFTIGVKDSKSMRLIGIAERAISLMLLRVTDPRKMTFCKQLYQHSATAKEILDRIQLLVDLAAHQIDLVKAIGYARASMPLLIERFKFMAVKEVPLLRQQAAVRMEAEKA
ncbi:hypothetical protein MJO29_013980, partial [Puccinia striiformis f. sp. tritici]